MPKPLAIVISKVIKKNRLKVNHVSVPTYFIIGNQFGYEDPEAPSAVIYANRIISKELDANNNNYSAKIFNFNKENYVCITVDVTDGSKWIEDVYQKYVEIP